MVIKLEIQAILDALGHGVLVFASDGKLVLHNMMAGTILGTDLNVIKSEGWSMALELFDTGSQAMDLKMEAVKEKALTSERPIRFKIYRSGAYVPCWAAALNGEDGEVYIMLTLDVLDWELVSNVIDRFRTEMHDAVDSTIGHINLINRTMGVDSKNQDPASIKLARRIGGFTKLIEVHMSRAGRLISMLDRLQDIRTGAIRDRIRDTRKKVDLPDFMEDFVEALDEIHLLDPESEAQDYRSRVKTEIPDDLAVNVSASYLDSALREILRNAIMYSLIGTPITITAQKKNNNVQIDMRDEGYGIRKKEYERIFDPFSRARQPQIIAEFGYGLALYLCKTEIEVMNGRLWFNSDEGVGTTFSMMLPLWKETDSSSRSDSNA
ncbi:MAG: HAMP domain-containing sensor histidine kinase [Anaerolineae bacterium]|nr:HAMP domain-containing sensor histidine kinase [Anaerolineae bacterium]MDQ7037201.1 HAMP domain-containing sensor histidine kinase [Anaerolineae bacterium]